MRIVISIAVSSMILLVGCGDSNDSNLGKEELGKKETLGKALFFDKNLSKDRNTACATCHDPEQAFVDTRFSKLGVDQSIFIYGALSVGDDGITLGGRNAPTAAYAMFSPKFGEKNGTYKGGQFHDGRAATLKIQAMGPPLDQAEMMMPDPASVTERLKENKHYVSELKSLFGNDIFDVPNKAFESMAECIGQFEKTEQFAPFDSKYDRWERGEYTFTAKEKEGYFVYFNSANTNCVFCHTLNSESEANTKEMFTNYEYENIGTPRNIAAMDARAVLGLQDADAKFAGLGATTGKSEHLGKTKVPTLRNIAVTGPYMNNGVFKELRTVLDYYDFMAGNGHHPINPETGKPWGATDYNGTVNYELLEKTKPLSDKKIIALEAFLRTLTDKKYEHLLQPLKTGKKGK